MDREELDRELDMWLDRAADAYGEAEIRPGFENRLSANLNSRVARRGWRFRWIPVAAALAVVLFTTVYILQDRLKDSGTTEIAPEKETHSMGIPVEDAELAGKRNEKPDLASLIEPVPKAPVRVKAKQRDRPKPAEPARGGFLSSGISDRERSLMAFIRAKSGEPSRDVSQNDISDPLFIAPLQLEKLRLPEFRLKDFEISSFEIEKLPGDIYGNEEKL